MTVRAKFNCRINNDREGIILDVIDPKVWDTPENKEFFKYTPSGQISLSILNPAASEYFEVDKSYYVDFTVAEVPDENIT